TDARHVLVVGAGQVARLLPHAYRTVRPIEQVSVWARDAAKAGALAADLQRQGLPARAVGDLQAACGEADIVSCATLATEPLVNVSRGEVPGRRSAQERTVFKSVGTALEDLAAAILVYEGPPSASP